MDTTEFYNCFTFYDNILFTEEINTIFCTHLMAVIEGMKGHFALKRNLALL